MAADRAGAIRVGAPDLLQALILTRLAPVAVAFRVGSRVGVIGVAIGRRGDDLDTIRGIAEGLRGRLARIPGLVDLLVERTVPVPRVQVRLDYERAALCGVTPAALTATLEALSNGRVVGQVVDGPRRFEVVLRPSDADRTTGALADLLVETPRGRVPRRSFDTVEEADGPNRVMRENGRRRIVVQANTDGSDMGAIVAAIRAEMARTPLPQGHELRLEGAFQAQEEASRTIAALSAVSLLPIFAVLYSRYRSVRLALLVMDGVPLAPIGSVAALWLAGQPLSVASMVGFVTLTGISARNGILRADAPGKEVLHPVAVTIFGGPISATPLDTLLTPAVFLAVGRVPVERVVARAEAEARAGGGRPAEAF